jgi:polynucleotide 5'-hydroxyl-kinase GRC3/NOL9
VKSFLKAGHTLLIQGPAAARVLSGIAYTLGKPLLLNEPLVVRAGRLKIVEAQDETVLDIVTGEGGKLDEIETSTIPSEWTHFAKEIVANRVRRLRVMVLGGADTGKNTFITYACNTLLREGSKVAVVDADMGQAEIGPPTTMSVAFIESPLSELLEARPNQIFFVGATSPAHSVERVLNGAERFMSFVNDNAPEAAMFVNMPGWVTGPGATAFILEMASRLEICCVAALQRENEVEEVLNGMPSNLQVMKLSASRYARVRSREERKFLRETSYRKYFANSKEIGVRYGKLDFSPLFSSRGREAPKEAAGEVERVVKSRVLYCDESNSSINAVVELHRDINSELAIEDDYQQQFNQTQLGAGTEQRPPKEIRIISELGLTDLVVSLLEKDNSLVSLGILKKIDFYKKRATIMTTIRVNEVARIEVGRVKLSPEGYEMGAAEILRVTLPRTSRRD